MNAERQAATATMLAEANDTSGCTRSYLPRREPAMVFDPTAPIEPIDRDAQALWRNSVSQDIADLRGKTSRTSSGLARTIAGLLRIIGQQNDDIAVLKDAAQRDSQHREHYAGSRAIRNSLSVPRIAKPTPKPSPLPPPKPDATDTEIRTYVAMLRRHRDTLANAAAKASNPAEKSRLSDLADKLEKSAVSWEAKLATSADPGLKPAAPGLDPEGRTA